MTNAQDPVVMSFTADSDLSTKQYYFVKPTSGPKVDLQDSATGANVGVLQNLPSADGMAAEVAVSGLTKVVYGGTVAVGDRLGSDTNGKAVAKTSDKDRVLGIAMVAGVAGDTGLMLYTGEAWLGV